MRDFFKKGNSLIKKENLGLFIVLLFSFFLRLLFLNSFPVGITHDELSYIISAKSLFWTGSFAPGTAPAIFPLGMTNFDMTIAEIPVLILAPLVGPFNFSLFVGRFFGALLSTLIILAVYLITKKLTDNSRIALICSLVLAINPWSFLIGRTIFEVNFFVAFFLWGFLILLNNKDWKIFYALPFYLLGFFSYTGGQISFYLFIILTLFFHYLNSSVKNIKNIRPYLLFSFLITAILFFYLQRALSNQSFNARSQEIFTPKRLEVSQAVDLERKTAVQKSFNSLFINKGTIYFKGFLEKYLNFFSVDSLFLKGEVRAAYSFQKHGFFYFFDFVFLLFGLSYLFFLNKKLWLFILSAVGIGAITSGLSVVEYSYAQRAGLSFPFLAILVGFGIFSAISLPKSEKFRKVLLLSVAFFYLALFLNLLHLYFFRFPVYAADGWYFQDRVLSRYLDLTSKQFPDKKIFVSSAEPKIIFEEYLFFSNNYQAKKIDLINKNLNEKNYVYGNINFIQGCFEDNLDKDTVWIYDSGLACKKNSQVKDLLRITRLRDIHEYYLIVNDETCSSQELNPFISSTAYKNFKVERQDKEAFCQNWITKLP